MSPSHALRPQCSGRRHQVCHQAPAGRGHGQSQGVAGRYNQRDLVATLAEGALNINASWSYKDDIVQFELPTPIIDQQAYDTINLSVVCQSNSGHWLLGVHGKKLTDEAVKNAGYCFGSGGVCHTAGPGRQYHSILRSAAHLFTASVEYRL